MKTVYVDPAFSSQGPRKIWSAGTVNAVDPGINYASNIGAALAMIADGDVIKLSRGTHALPDQIQVSCTIASMLAGSPTIATYTPSLPSQKCVVDSGKTVRFVRGQIVGPFSVSSNIVFDNTEVPPQGIQNSGSAVVMIGKTENQITRDATGFFERYDSYYNEGRWQSAFPIADYRNPATLMAPAKGRSLSGTQKVIWVSIAEFRYAQKDLSGTETGNSSVNFAISDMYLFTKPGLVAHPDMRIVTKGRTLQIKQVFPPDAPGQDLKILATAYTGG